MSVASKVGSQRQPWLTAERLSLAGFAGLVIVALAIPPIEQPATYHAFADTRAWAGMPNAANVLSNAAFIVAGLVLLLGLALPAARGLTRVTRIGLLVIAAGVLCTAWGSGYYHSTPNNATLVWDRLPMTIAFAGVMAVILAQRVTTRAGWVALPLLLATGIASVVYWSASGNIVPYAVLQVGVMIALMLFVLLTARRDDPFPWWWVIAGYALAKVGETFDASIFAMTHQAISGHTLKHLFAALAVAGFAWPLYRPAQAG